MIKKLKFFAQNNRKTRDFEKNVVSESQYILSNGLHIDILRISLLVKIHLKVFARLVILALIRTFCYSPIFQRNHNFKNYIMW